MRRLSMMVMVGAIGCGSTPNPNPNPNPSPSTNPSTSTSTSTKPSTCNGRASCLTACRDRAPGACLRLVRMLSLRVVVGQPLVLPDDVAVALTAACDAGDAAVCGEMAELHCTLASNVLTSCQPAALSLASRACDAGAPAGCVHLGLMHEAGVLDMAESGDDARPFFEKSLPAFAAECRAGDARACLQAGGQHEQYRGTQDVSPALPYFERAFELGNTGCEAGDPLACLVAGIAAHPTRRTPGAHDQLARMCERLEPEDCAAWRAANPTAP